HPSSDFRHQSASQRASDGLFSHEINPQDLSPQLIIVLVPEYAGSSPSSIAFPVLFSRSIGDPMNRRSLLASAAALLPTTALDALTRLPVPEPDEADAARIVRRG